MNDLAPPVSADPAVPPAPPIDSEVLSTAKAKRVVEAALLVASVPLSMLMLQRVFDDAIGLDTLRTILDALVSDFRTSGVELVCVSEGWRFQGRQEMLPFLGRVRHERKPTYSRAALETLATIAYRQPVTRTDIEEARGIGVNTQTIQSFIDREWVEVIGHRQGPGMPALYATTRKFLDDLGVESLSDLPLADPKALQAPDENEYAFQDYSDQDPAHAALESPSFPLESSGDQT